VHAECVGKTPENFHKILNEFNKQKQALAEISTVTPKLFPASFKVAYIIAKCKNKIFCWRKFSVITFCY
jgi:hypothetical protein